MRASATPAKKAITNNLKALTLSNVQTKLTANVTEGPANKIQRESDFLTLKL